MALSVVVAAIALLLVVGVSGAALAPALAHRFVYGVGAGASALACLAGAWALVSGAAPQAMTLPLGLPWMGAHLRLDALSAFFLVIVDLGGALAGLFALGHGRHEVAPRRVLPFVPAFLAAMNLVVIADDAFVFLLAWEAMSLVSWALVMAHHHDEANRHAGFVYLTMASLGTLALLLAFGLMAGAEGAYTFAAMRVREFPALAAGLTFVLALTGAGSKAGLVPLHVWLPLAHPAAPSQVSALMSGVMTKVAVYGFVRIVFDLLGGVDWWAGTLVLALAGATAVLGVLNALMQHDLKRLLAYHTVENIGIIFIGLGLALAFQTAAMPRLAALSLIAALLHALNHSLFKSLLFFGAGAVLEATEERDMERLGGLIHRLPITAFAFLVGCAAISALPPLNGFVSEWLTFQAVLQSPALPHWGLRILVPTVGALLALSAALAAACFVKAFGITFLGRPRSGAAARACEVDALQRTAMLVYAGLCLVVGVLPGLAIDALAPVPLALVGERLPPQAGLAWLTLVPLSAGQSSYNGLLILAFIAFSAGLAVVVIHRLASSALRRAPAWDCGFPDASPLTQYSATSFAQPIRRVFAPVFRAHEEVSMPPPGDARPARLVVSVADPVWERVYLPIASAVGIVADRLNRMQFLTIRRYLMLVFLALVALLAALALWT